jgi:hypothetical protein
MVITLNPEPDWENILAQFANALEQCGGRLLVLAKETLHAVRAVPEGQGKTEVASIRSASPKLTARPSAQYPEGGGREHEMSGPAYGHAFKAMLPNRGTYPTEHAVVLFFDDSSNSLLITHT